ncbi:MAG TPA: hypothetical protein ENJ40_00575 [Thermosulfurimonas dismutans]|uniref:Uncharacterized protein n=1 Tax=Thermosulfurimonas dismutans TaxID=999894 RepID=A0A7C3GFK7_9BACT|nr:hypothetical protein [Thermosulfurimonas dismutans]
MSFTALMVKALALDEAGPALAERVALSEELSMLAERAVASMARAALLVTEEIEPAYGREVAERVFEVLGFSYAEGRKLSGLLERMASLSAREREAALKATARATLKLLGLEGVAHGNRR